MADPTGEPATSRISSRDRPSFFTLSKRKGRSTDAAGSRPDAAEGLSSVWPARDLVIAELQRRAGSRQQTSEPLLPVPKRCRSERLAVQIEQVEQEED